MRTGTREIFLDTSMGWMLQECQSYEFVNSGKDLAAQIGTLQSVILRWPRGIALWGPEAAVPTICVAQGVHLPSGSFGQFILWIGRNR